MVIHCDQQLQQFAEYLVQQEISLPIKKCIYEGMVGWINSEVDKPRLYAPTIGQLMPAEKMATKAFADQTGVGWESFFSWTIMFIMAQSTFIYEL